MSAYATPADRWTYVGAFVTGITRDGDGVSGGPGSGDGRHLSVTGAVKDDRLARAVAERGPEQGVRRDPHRGGEPCEVRSGREA